jgi:hypothetical protein
MAFTEHRAFIAAKVLRLFEFSKVPWHAAARVTRNFWSIAIN